MQQNMLPSMRLSVVMPAYNKDASIETVRHKVLQLEQLHEVIVIDDGSTDATPSICKQLAKAGGSMKRPSATTDAHMPRAKKLASKTDCTHSFTSLHTTCSLHLRLRFLPCLNASASMEPC